MFGNGGPFGNIFGNDPFFADPFSQMDRMMNSMFSNPFFGNPLLHPGPLAQQLPHQRQHSRGRQPVIEEVDDVDQVGRTATARDEPIVEEPDEDADGYPHDRAPQRQRRHSPPRAAAAPTQMDPFGSLFGALATGAGGGGSSFVFSSSSYSSTGPGGVSYQASSTTRVGPGGVRETQSVVRDGRSGTEAVTISRGLGDGRQRTLVRRRDASGREEQLEDLQGVAEDEADVFDDQWRQHAERNLPGGGSFGAVSGRLGAGGGSTGSSRGHRPLALPNAAATGAPSYGTQPYDSGIRSAAGAADRGMAAAATSLRPSYPTHGMAGLSRQNSAGGSHYAPSSSGRSTVSGAGGSAGVGAGSGYGGGGLHGVAHGPYAYGSASSAYGNASRPVSGGAGFGGHRVSPTRERYTPRHTPPSTNGSGGGRSTHGRGAYASVGQGQQRSHY